MRIVYTGGVITVASIAAAALAGFLDQAAAKTVLVNLAPGPASFSPYASIPLGVQAAGQGLNFDFTGANPAAGSSPINIEMEYRIYDDGVLSF